MSFSQSANTVILTVENHQDRSSFGSFNDVLHLIRGRLRLLISRQAEKDHDHENKHGPERRNDPVEGAVVFSHFVALCKTSMSNIQSEERNHSRMKSPSIVSQSAQI